MEPSPVNRAERGLPSTPLFLLLVLRKSRPIFMSRTRGRLPSPKRDALPYTKGSRRASGHAAARHPACHFRFPMDTRPGGRATPAAAIASEPTERGEETPAWQSK